MRTGLFLAAILAFGCNEKTSDAPTPAPGKQAPGTQAASVAAAGPAAALVAGLSGVGKACEAAGGTPHEIQRCTPYRRFLAKQRRAIGAYSPEMPDTVEPFKARLEVAFAQLTAGDPWVRAAARGVVEMGLVVGQSKPSPHTDAFIDRVLDRVEQAKDAKERVLLLGMVGNYAVEAHSARLLAVGQSADHDEVRGAAWASLARCAARGCKTSPDVLKAAWQSAKGPHTKGGLGLLAGWIRMPQAAEWCAGLLDDAKAGRSCRAGMKRLKTDAAYDLLLARSDRLSEAKPGNKDQDVEAAGALMDLSAVADVPKAGTSVYDRIDAFLRAPRHPQAALRVAGQLLFMKDKPRALDMAVAHYTRLKSDASRPLVVNRLRRVVASLGGGERIGLKTREPALGSKPQPGGHAGHDHGAHGPAGGHPPKKPRRAPATAAPGHGHAHGPNDGHVH
jgi:hypothetical protein